MKVRAFFKLSHVFILFFIFQVLSGCSMFPVWIPGRFATLQEAYPPGEILGPAEVLPSDSKMTRVFNAAYEDVFRAAFVSASQAQWSVEVQDKAKGVILGTRVLQIQPPPDTADCPNNQSANKRPSQRNYYYAVVIKEKGPKSTEVTAVARAQGRCEHKACLQPSLNANCERYASVHWATGHDNALSDLNQFMVFISNNLIAAGVI